MQINPYTETVGDIAELNNLSITDSQLNFEAKLKELKESGDVLAVGPKEHLQALQQKLMKQGFKSIK